MSDSEDNLVLSIFHNDEGELTDDSYELISDEDEALQSVELTDDEPLTLNESGHIQAIHFSHVVDRMQVLPSFFMGAPDWKQIPGVVVLTGINGSGKSSILNYMAGLLRSHTETNPNRFIHIDTNRNLFVQNGSGGSRDTSYDLSDQKRSDKLMTIAWLY